MKRIFLLAILGILGLNQINAQFSLGASAGPNFANVKFSQNIVDFANSYGTTYHSTMFYFFGVIPKYNITTKLSVSSDIQYSLKGFEYRNSNYINKYKYTYLDFLPKVEYQIFKFIEIGLGFNIGFKLDEHQKTGNGEWLSTKEFGTIINHDFGLVGSIRGSFRNFFMIVAYNYGLTDLSSLTFTDDNGQSIGEVEQFNRNLQIGVGYFFQFKKNKVSSQQKEY